MISHLTGTVVEVGRDGVVVLQVGGIGLEVAASARAIRSARIGAEVTMPAVLVVREDSWTCFGFLDRSERAAFQSVQSVRGIGPRLAMAILSTLTPEDLRDAVGRGDAKALTAVPGIGIKGAQRMVIDLRDRLGPLPEAPAASSSGAVAQAAAGAPAGWSAAVVDALIGLGWQQQEATAAVGAVAAEREASGVDGGPDDLAALLRAALRRLDRSRPEARA